MTVSAGTLSAVPGHRVPQHRAVLAEAVERRERAHLQRSAAQAREQLHAALRGQRAPKAAPGVATVMRLEAGAGRRARRRSRTATSRTRRPPPAGCARSGADRWRPTTAARARCPAGPAAARRCRSRAPPRRSRRGRPRRTGEPSRSSTPSSRVRVEVQQRAPPVAVGRRSRDGELPADRLARVEQHDLSAAGERQARTRARPVPRRRSRRARRRAPRPGARRAARPAGGRRRAARAPG